MLTDYDYVYTTVCRREPIPLLHYEDIVLGKRSKTMLHDQQK